MSARSDRVRVIEQAEKYVRSGRVKDAITEYEKLALTDPQDVGTLNIIGDLYMRLGHNDRAVEFFLKVAQEYERRGLYSQALAIYKKIHKLNPENVDYSLKLGDLFGQQGFLADAKNAYLAIARRLVEARKAPEAMAVFEKVIKLDREDIEARKALSGLYRDSGNLDAALEQLNDIAEIRAGHDQFEAAVGVLDEALALRPGDNKSVVSLVEVHKRQNQTGKAIELLERQLESAPDNVQFLNLLGNIHFEAGETKKAEEIFSQIVTGHPLNVNARIKLGRIQILKDKLDQAYELFEPLINNLVKKHRDEKAIGLLGLILESQKPHLPALERLALIYRSNKEMKKLEVVDRAILDELRKQGDKDRMVAVYSELLELRPDDADIAREARALRLEKGLPAEEDREEMRELLEKDREAIQEGMAQADLYMQQGLVRISRRLLENLRFRYPEEPQIQRKIAVLDEVRTHMDEEEIRRRVEKTSVLEAEFKEKTAEKKAEDRKTEVRKKTAGPFKDEVLEGDKVSTADIFAETDILPFVSSETGQKKYYDLKALAAEELRLLAAASALQLRGDASQYERELSGIVAEFRKDFRTKVEGESAETHYQLGLAFMGQGLTGEAVEEFTHAAKDKGLVIDSYSMISQSYRQKRNYDEAEKWLKMAMAAAKQGTDQYYALLYELAEIMEESDNREKAISLFKQIYDWNPGYRNISARFESLKKSPAD
ncbi:MAG: tetratricopeptide repeat protein [Candidatus Aminicenantes bacterium]|nr:tetratricopeptide repeat protein [Candidatus Aminicenantes bacterium]TFG58195.1 MAG: tetratricopeptide repeat protein [Candidatus Aminicenantes bacterium]